ncbi:MAG: VOC family protein [Acidobacteriota bacterium]|nr:VOC family protein [Acidobacteriota bacterium]
MASIQSVHPVIMSSDVGKTLDFLSQLGFTVEFRDNLTDTKYAGVTRDSVELHIQWNDLSGIPPMADRPTLRFVVDSVDDMVEELESEGFSGIEPFATPWGTYEFHLQDHDRNGYQFYVDRS